MSALLSYPTADLQGAVPVLRAALDAESVVPAKQRGRLEPILAELASHDLYDLQERYILLFDRTRSLSLHLFEHVHGETRDRGQAMVDLAQLYERHGVAVATSELPDYLPLFLEFLSLIRPHEAKGLIGETAHILELIRQRLKKRGSTYSSVLSAITTLAQARVADTVAERVAAEPVDDPNDLAALDAAWLDAEVRFGPASADACGRDGLAAKLRAGRRSAQPAPPASRPTVTVNGSPRE
jgi:nitrate reductase delta subunit